MTDRSIELHVKGVSVCITGSQLVMVADWLEQVGRGS